MDFDEAEVVLGVALQLGDVVHVQARVLHRLAHGHAIGVGLRQPVGIELPDQRARAEKSGLVPLAFFFGKADHLEIERQTAPRAVQLAHAGNGHEDAQAPVVFTAVAHSVVVAAGHECFGALALARHTRGAI